jgi:serine phosphatase RsbU (regulator of sigma subunit)
MATTGNTTVLRNTFAKLERRTLDELRELAQRRTYPAQTVLIRQGEVGHVFYVIVKGRVAVVRTLEDGEERLEAMRGPNEFFGEMSLLDDTVRLANCITLTETTVLEVTEELFERLVEESPAVAFAVMHRILETARAMDKESIASLNRKNEALARAYAELKTAQAELVEKHRLEHELELAARVQRSLLPEKLPARPGHRFAAYLKPARFVGGDFYDVLELDDDHIGLLIADVADKGVQAALFMAMTRALFSQEARHSLSPATVARAVHEGALRVAPSSDLFVTAFYGVLQISSGELTYVRAGHDRPLVVDGSSEVKALRGDGRFLGMWQELHLTEYSVQLVPGDRLLMYSDGLPDASNHNGDQFGVDRLEAVLRQAGSRSADDLLSMLAAAVEEWCQDAPPFDDLTMLVVELEQ